MSPRVDGAGPRQDEARQDPHLTEGGGLSVACLRAKEGLATHGSGTASVLVQSYRAGSQEAQGAQGQRTGPHPKTWAASEVGRSVRSFP